MCGRNHLSGVLFGLTEKKKQKTKFTLINIHQRMREKSYVGDGIDRKSQQRKENYFKMDI